MEHANVVVNPEPNPTPNAEKPVWELVIDDMRARDNFGRAKYGTPLQAFNDRDCVKDAYQEALDLVVYLRQHIEERENIGVTKALVDVLAERKRQDEKWGEQNHNPYIYLAILLEEVGEYAQAILQTKFEGKVNGEEHMRKEAVQIAAVAVALVECLDRGNY